MLTIRLGEKPGVDNLVFAQENPSRDLKAGEILVKIEASSINPHDYAVIKGQLKSAPGRVLLSDGAGVVEAVGQDVHALKVGDRVMSCFFPEWQDGESSVDNFSTTPGDGTDGYARSYVVRPAHYFTLAPRHLSAVESATLPTAGLTAWRSLVVEGNIKAGDSVLILGTGGVSLFALQIAKMFGATVVMTSSSDEKLAKMKSLGADHVVNYRTHAEWGRRVRELTGGRGVNHVIEIGGPGTLAQSITAGAIGAKIYLIGVLTGIAGQVPTAMLMFRQQKLIGVTVGNREHQLEMVKAFEDKKVHPYIAKTFKLAEFKELLKFQDSGDHMGKIAIEM